MYCGAKCLNGKSCGNWIKSSKITCYRHNCDLSDSDSHSDEEEESDEEETETKKVISREVRETTGLLSVLSDIVAKLLVVPQPVAYLIGGYMDASSYATPFPIDSITTVNENLIVKYGENDKTWGGSSITSCAVGKYIYVFGGKNVPSRNVVTLHHNTWKTGESIPNIPESLPGRNPYLKYAPVVVGSKIYVLPEYFYKNDPMYVLDTTNLAKAEWRQCGSRYVMPRLLYSTICSIGKFIYAFEYGSWSKAVHGYNGSIYEFDTVEEEWRQIVINDFILLYNMSRTVVIDERIYLFGDSYLCVFEPKEKTMRMLPCSPQSGIHPFVLGDDKYIYAVTRFGERILTFDVQQEKWLDNSVVLSKEERLEFSIVTVHASSPSVDS
jgi:hypothetical protein